MKKALYILGLLMPFAVKGQDNYTLKFMPQLQQSQWFCPTNQPDAAVSIGLPGLSGASFYIYNSGFTYHDVFKSPNDSQKSVNMGAIFNQLKPINYVTAGISVPLFSINVAKENYSFGFSINDKADFQFSYPDNTFKLLWYGNGYYLGKNLQVGNFGLNASWYREFALHAAVTSGNWTFGASPKLLFGMTNINTVQSSLVVNTNPNDFYKVTATANMNIQMSGIADSTDNNKGGYFNTTANALGYVFNPGNPGFAIDLGAKYAFDEHLNVGGGINNLGFISWRSNIHNYTVDNASFVFDGLHAENYLQGDTTSLISTTLHDSIKNIIKFNKNSDHYMTYTPYDIYLMGNYDLRNNWFGLELSARRFNGFFLYSATACYQLRLGKYFSGVLTYTVRNYAPFNIGGGIVLRALGMQFFAVTDNWYAAVVPLDSKNANLNFGMNLAFGNRKKTNNPKDRLDFEPQAQ